MEIMNDNIYIIAAEIYYRNLQYKNTHSKFDINHKSKCL